MGRKRTRNHNLPPRMHRKGNVYYYVTSRGGKRRWERLSDVYSEALALWAFGVSWMVKGRFFGRYLLDPRDRVSPAGTAGR